MHIMVFANVSRATVVRSQNMLLTSFVPAETAVLPRSCREYGIHLLFRLLCLFRLVLPPRLFLSLLLTPLILSWLSFLPYAFLAYFLSLCCRFLFVFSLWVFFYR